MKIIFAKGTPVLRSDNSYSIGEWTVREVNGKDIQDGIGSIINDFEEEMKKNPALFTREAAETYVWDLYAQS